jgi:hypothetical protein
VPPLLKRPDLLLESEGGPGAISGHTSFCNNVCRAPPQTRLFQLNRVRPTSGALRWAKTSSYPPILLGGRTSICSRWETLTFCCSVWFFPDV